MATISSTTAYNISSVKTRKYTTCTAYNHSIKYSQCRPGNIVAKLSFVCLKPKTTPLRPAAMYNSSGESDYGNEYEFLHESMTILRKRIKEIEEAEGKGNTPVHWMEWEKQYYKNYRSDVCEFVGLVQMMMMKTQPGLAIGLLGFITLSVPTSALLICMHLAVAVKTGLIGS